MRGTHRSVETKHTDDAVRRVALDLDAALELDEDEVATDLGQGAGGVGREVLRLERQVDTHGRGVLLLFE